MAASELISNRCRTLLDEIAKREGFEKYQLLADKALTLGENYTGDVFKLAITGVKKDKPESLYLIVKVSLKLSQCRQNNFVKSIYEREAYVYSKMLPVLDWCQRNLPQDERFEFAKLYATLLEEDDEIIVMEDLSKRGYRMLDRLIPYTYEQLVVIVKTMARFHATSFVLREKQPKVYEEIHANTSDHTFLRTSLENFVGSNAPAIRNMIENKPYEKTIGRILDNLAEEFDQVYSIDVSDPHSVLIHGDSWTNNLLFHDKDGTTDGMVFVDWQIMRNCSPVVDLSYPLMMGIDSQIRRRHYNEILDLYYEVLSSNVTKMGVDISKYYPQSVYREHVQKYMKYGLMLAFSALPMMMCPKEDAATHNELFETFANKDAHYKTRISNACHERFKGLFEDCVKLNII